MIVHLVPDGGTLDDALCDDVSDGDRGVSVDGASRVDCRACLTARRESLRAQLRAVEARLMHLMHH